MLAGITKAKEITLVIIYKMTIKKVIEITSFIFIISEEIMYVTKKYTI